MYMCMQFKDSFDSYQALTNLYELATHRLNTARSSPYRFDCI